MNLQDFRQRIPQLNGLSDADALDILHKNYYPTVDKQRMADVLGVNMARPAAPVPERGMLRGMADIGLSVGQGAVGAVKSLTDLGGADNVVSQGLGSMSEYLQDKKSDQSKATMANSQARIKEAEATGDWKDQAAAYMNMLWDQPGEMIAQGVGSFAPMLVTGPLAASAKLASAAKAAGMSKEAFLATEAGQKAIKAAADVAFKTNMGVGAAQGVGTVKGAQYEQTFNAAKAQGKTDEEATALATEAQAYGGAGTAQQLLGGALGAGAAATGPIERVIAGKSGQAGQGLMARTLQGAVTEAVPEGLQGGQERYAGNTAAIDAGVLGEDARWRGVVGQGLMEGAVGGLLGGGAGAVNRSAPESDIDPAKAAGDAVRANKVPESGPMSRAANMSVEVSAQMAEKAMSEMEQQNQKDLQGLRDFAGRTPNVVGSAPAMPGQAGATTDQASAEFVDSPFSDRLLTLQEQLADPANRERVRARWGDQGLSDILYYAGTSNRTGIPERTQENMLTMAERLLAESLLTPIQPTTEVGGMVRDPMTLGNEAPAAQGPAMIGMNQTPSGRFTVDSQGQAAPETTTQKSDAQRRAQDIAAMGQAETGKRSAPEPVLGSRLSSTPMADMLGGTTDPVAGILSNRRQAIQDVPSGMAERSRTDGKPLTLPTADPVRDYVDGMRKVNTPAAKFYVSEFDAGRITPADVQQRIQAERGKTPDERLSDAAAQAPKNTAQPGDILNPSGQPFKTLMSARLAAQKTPGDVIEVVGGYSVRPKTEATNAQAAPVPASVQAVDQGAAPGVEPDTAAGPAKPVATAVARQPKQKKPLKEAKPVAADANPESDIGQKDDRKSKAYQLPEAVSQDWPRAERSDFEPSPRQQVVMDAVASALDEGKYYTDEVRERVSELLGVSSEVLARNKSNVQGGDFGYDVYYARKAVEAQRANKKSRQLADEMALKPGDVLGTLVANDYKRMTGVKVVSISDSGLSAVIEAKRGTATVRGEMGVDALKAAFDRANERGNRKDTYADFVKSRSKPAKPDMGNPTSTQEAPVIGNPATPPVAEIPATTPANEPGLPDGWKELRNGFNNRPVYRLDQDGGKPFAVVQRNGINDFSIEIRQGDKRLSQVDVVKSKSDALAFAKSKLDEASGIATHKDPGEKPEAATPAVVAESLKTAAKNEDVKPSDMKKWLLGELDKAMLAAPDRNDYDDTVKGFGAADAVKMWTGDGRFGKDSHTGFLNFDVPGDGKFKVRNGMRGLLEFRQNVERSKGFSNTGARPVAPERNNGVQGGSGGQMSAITNMIEEGDFEAARDYAEAVGIALADVNVPRGDRKPQWDAFMKDGTLPLPPDTKPRPAPKTAAQLEEEKRQAAEAEAKKPKDTGWNMAGTGYGGKRYIGRNIITDDGREIVARVYENAGTYEEAEVRVDGARKFAVTDRYNAQDKADAFIRTLTAKTSETNAEAVAVTAAKIARREDPRSQDARVDRVAMQETYLQDLARNTPDQAAKIAEQLRAQADALSEVAGVSPQMIGKYASIIERQLKLTATDSKPATPQGIAGQTFDQWVKDSYQNNEYKDRYLSKFGDEKKAMLGSVIGSTDTDMRPADMLKEAKLRYFKKLLDLPRETSIALEVWDGLNDGQRLEAQSHFYDLEARIVRRTQDESAAKAKAKSNANAEADAPAGRIYLAVPFADKDNAKQYGATWDAEKKLWFADPLQDGEINLNLQKFIPRDSTADDRYNYYSAKDVAQVVAINASARDGIEYELKKRTHPDGMVMWSVMKPGAADKPAKPVNVTPQVSGNPEKFIKVAADSVRELRAMDVDRVLTETPVQFRAEVAMHIKDKRKDLAGEVDDAMADLRGGNAAPAQPAAEPEPVTQRRDPTKVSMFNPYEDGDTVAIDGQDWTVKQDTPGWYLTNTGNWRGTHPTIRNIKAMSDLIRAVEQAAVAQPAPTENTAQPSEVNLNPPIQIKTGTKTLKISDPKSVLAKMDAKTDRLQRLLDCLR